MGTIAALVIVWAWVVAHWKIVVAALVALILIVRARRKARYKKALQIIEASQQAKPRPPQPAPAPSTPSAPRPSKPQFIKPPEVQDRFCLEYFYPDVEFIVPPAYERSARQVPPLKTLTVTLDTDSSDVYLAFEGYSLGRMKDNRLRDMVRDFDREDRAVLATSALWSDKPLFSLAFYETLEAIHEKWRTYDDYREYTLTGNRNEDMQNSIFALSEGYPVEPQHDFEKDKYLAIADGLEIGYFPHAFEDYLSEHDAVKARILSITEKDDGRYSVRVMMIPS